MMKKYLNKLKKISKFNWIAISIIVITFFTYYGVTNYMSMSNEEAPKWIVCEQSKGNRKALYLKFHNTDKIQWDHKKRKWIKSRYTGLREVMPTIEMNEDRSYFFKSWKSQFKLRSIYQSDKYYVFYQTTGGFSFIPGIAPVRIMAQHIIMNRDDLSLLYYENEWIRNKSRQRKYDDEEIDKLFKEVNSIFYSRTENIILSNGKTLVTSKSLDFFQCKEVSSFKPKI